MSRFLILVALLLASSATRHAQASAINQWPQPATIKPGTHLVLGLHSDSLNTTACRLKSLDADHIVCSGRHHVLVSYHRANVAIIQRARLSFPIGLLFKEGILVVLVGLSCATDGGPICITPAVIGLSMMAGSVALFFVEVAHNHGSRFLYIEPVSIVPTTGAN